MENIEWDKYRKSLVKFVSARIKDEEEANDLVQEIYAKALRKLPTYNPRYAFSTWLFAIAEHSCIDHYRKTERRKRREEKMRREMEPARGSVHGETHSDTRSETPAGTSDGESEIFGEALLELVPPKYKKVFKMRYIKRMKYKEIAKACRLPMGTVKTWLYRAKAALHESRRAANGANEE